MFLNWMPNKVKLLISRSNVLKLIKHLAIKRQFKQYFRIYDTLNNIKIPDF